MPDKFRIGIDGRELLPDLVTGIARYLRNFLGFAVPAHPEHRFTIYSNRPVHLDLQAPNLHCRILPERLTLWWDQVLLARLARKDRLDVFLSPYDKGPLFAPCPVVLTVHDLLFLAISDRGALSRFLYNAVYVGTRRLAFRKAACIITDSEYSREDIVRRLGVPPERISAIPIGISDAYRPVRDPAKIGAFKARYGIAGPYILYVGNFKPHKNVKTLLRAYAALPESLRSTRRLILCGRKDAFRDEVQREAQTLNLNGRVLFLDFVEEADMPLLYAGAELFAFPSLYEGFGLPPLEAMACGTPVVSSRATSLPEVVGNAGILVDARRPEDLRRGIETLLTRPDRRQSLARAGLRRARAFTLEQAAEKIVPILEEAARRRER